MLLFTAAGAGLEATATLGDLLPFTAAGAGLEATVILAGADGAAAGMTPAQI